MRPEQYRQLMAVKARFAVSNPRRRVSTKTTRMVIAVEELVERRLVDDVLVGLLPGAGFFGRPISRPAARCFDQASFEVIGQRAIVATRGSAVMPPLGSCGRRC